MHPFCPTSKVTRTRFSCLDNQERVSYGEEKPAAFGSDEAAWEKNRRVEIVYQPK